MFTIEQFVSDCQDALRETNVTGAIRELVERALSDPETARTFEPDRSAFDVLHRSPDLTVLHVGLPPYIGSSPHDHRMWAVIGVLDGQEDNTFFRRGEDALVPSGGRQLEAKGMLSMGDDTIHAIRNPRTRYLSALHVYGGDLLGVPRSQWDDSGRNERPYDEAAIEGRIKRLRSEEDKRGRGFTAEEIKALSGTDHG